MPLQASAIIVAAGSSRRAGFDKLMAPLCGKSVLQHSVDAFVACEAIREIIVVTDQARFETLTAPINSPLKHSEGGAERHFSVSNGLDLAQFPFVMVHDGARPLITAEGIMTCLETAHTHQAAALARPITETLKRANSDGFIDESVDREKLWAMETPQTFSTPLLKEAYAKILREEILVTDEVSAMEVLGIPTKLVSHSAPNLKITYAEDLRTASFFCSPPNS